MATPRKKPEDRLPLGRPSAYKPEFCEIAIAMGQDGASKVDIADALDTTVKTIYNWMAQYPEFLRAMERAEQKAEVWWAEQGKKALWTPGFNSSVWSRSMAARFPKSWRENKSVELSGKHGAPIEMDVTTTLSIDHLSARALDALEEALEIIAEGEEIDEVEEDDGEDDEGLAN